MSKSTARSRFLLPEEEIQEIAQKHLQRPESAIAGRPDDPRDGLSGVDISSFEEALEKALLKRFTATEELQAAWCRAKPIALGSWARRELCPKSDLDLLFVGDHDAAAAITRFAQEAGIKIRSRIPESSDDWCVGVEAFDVLALLSARPLTSEAQALFDRQLTEIRKNLKSSRRGYFAAIRKERKTRSERFDSIANFLEPNLKYGPGGLRDMGQAFQLRALYPERFHSPERAHALGVFDYYKKFFLLSRIRVQLTEGGGDLLSAYEQAGVAEWFGFQSTRDFMREIQRGLTRVSFYADVDFEHVKVSARELLRFTSRELDFVELAFWMEREPTILVQAKARDIGFRLFKSTNKKSAENALRRLLVKAVDPLQSDALIIALFRSRWIDLVVTDFKKIVGYVQHDQYHRYTVDAHLLQAVREMKRVAQRPTILGRLQPIAKNLSREDWKILGWAALYHDVGKGSGGDHSDKSVIIAGADLKRLDIPSEIIDEVIWLIENHLELSLAAFRGNPAHPATWRMLHVKGIEGKRLQRLAVFTAVDIRATNREAYTPWKERLLAELVKYLEMPEAKQLAKLENELKTDKQIIDRHVMDRLDPFLVAALPTKVLAGDLRAIAKQVSSDTHANEIFVKLVKLSKANRVWIRFHTQKDRRGLFVQIVRALQAAGLSVRHASIMSDDLLGVYDWFEIKPPRHVKGLELKLSGSLASLESKGAVPLAEGIFDDVDCLSKNETEWVIGFRGKDTRGALLLAAEALTDEGLSIIWAKVHTWGRQIDDVFGVAPPVDGTHDGSSERLLLNLKKRVGR